MIHTQTAEQPSRLPKALNKRGPLTTAASSQLPPPQFKADPTLCSLVSSSWSACHASRSCTTSRRTSSSFLSASGRRSTKEGPGGKLGAQVHVEIYQYVINIGFFAALLMHNLGQAASTPGLRACQRCYLSTRSRHARKPSRAVGGWAHSARLLKHCTSPMHPLPNHS